MTDSDEEELLFFETFSHDNSEDLNLDLVQFPRPIVITEVRVVPLGTRVVADVPGNVRLGATNPSSFKLELFVNNLGKPNSSTFEKLGMLDYKANVDIQLRTETEVATDGLIIKGWYQMITLAVYGKLTTVRQERSSPPPPPPPQIRTKPTAAVPGALDKPDMVLTQKATLERTSEWAEKAAAALATVSVQGPQRPGQTASSESSREPHRSGSSSGGGRVTEPLHSPIGSPSAVNPRDIPLEIRGGTARDPREAPRDPRDRSPRVERDDREPGEIYEERMLAAAAADERRDVHAVTDSGEQEIAVLGRRRTSDNRSRSSVTPDKSDTFEQRAADRDIGRLTPPPKKDYDSFGLKDSDRERRSSSKSSDRKRTDSHSMLSPRSNSPPAKQATRKDAQRSLDSGPEEDTEPGEIPEVGSDLYGSIEGEMEKSPNAVMDKIYGALSDGEIQEGDGDYSQISSDENNFQLDDDLPSNMVDLPSDWDTEDGWKYDTVASFNPYQCELASLETFSDPSLTAYELHKQKLLLAKPAESPQLPPEAEQILSIIETFRAAPHHEAWIEAMESLPGLIVPGLVYLVNRSDNHAALETIINWAFEGLDLNQAVCQPETAYKVRHLKMGIKIAGALCTCDSYIGFKMLSREVQHRLLDLYVSPHMSSSVKLHIISALDQTTRLQEGLDWLLGRHHVQVAAAKPATSQSDQKSAGEESACQESSETAAVKMEQSEQQEQAAATAAASAAAASAAAAAKVETAAGEGEVGITCYQRLVEIVITKQCVRPMVGLTALLRKAHVYEVLLKLMSTVESLLDNMPSTEGSAAAKAALAAAGGTSTEEVGETAMELEMMDSALVLDTAIIDDIYMVIRCLEEVAKVLADPDSIIGQLRRTLPNMARFTVTKKPQSTYPNLFHMFNVCRLLESSFVLLCSPATCNHPGVFTAIRNIIMSLMSTQAGLLYLSSKVLTVNNILRALLQNSEYAQDEDRELNVANLLGLLMIYHLQTIQHIDQLNEYRAKDAGDKDLDDAEMLAMLHSLYSITFSPVGRDAVVSVFTLDDNIEVLMPFIEMTGDEQHDGRVRRSVCYAYAVMMLVLIARHSDHAQWLEKFGHRLLAFTEKEVSISKTNERVTELLEWLAPVKHVVVFQSDSATVTEIVAQIKQFSDDVADLPKGLITALRMLHHLAVAPENHDSTSHIEELKYKYVIGELHGANCLPLFVIILQKVHDILLLPWQQGFPQSISQKTLILSLVRPILAIMKATLSYLVVARGSEYKDLSCLPCLLNIHTVMCSVSSTGVLAPDIQQIQNDIVDILMAFTQPCLAKEESEEALNQSLWSMMVKHVLTYTLMAPYTFLSGLILVSEMLPIPLPVQTKELLTPEELMEIVNNRKRWSAHLHPHSVEIQNIIRGLAGSSCHPLHQVLRRVCWQLADLAVLSALTVVRALLDTLLESMDASNGSLPAAGAASGGGSGAVPVEAGQVERKRDEMPSSSQTARILALFSFLLNQTQAAIKAAFLTLPLSGIKSDEKYNAILPRLVSLLNIVSESPSHIQAQESIVSIFQSLCDIEITLIPPESRLSSLELIANSLPSKSQLALLCTGLLEHINNRDQKFSSILPSLRTLTLLMSHDYGFYYVKQAMEKVTTAFFNLFMQINATFSKDSSDCIATLSSAAECIEFLVSLPEASSVVTTIGPDGEQLPPPTPERTYTMSYAEVRDMLSWSARKDVIQAHPLNDLDVLLCEYAKDEETLKAVYQSVNAVVGILRSDEDLPSRPEVVEPMIPEPLSLSAQFNMRSIYLLTEDEDDRLSNIYWLSTPMGDESDHEQDMAKVKCNFLEMSKVYCPNFDFKAELEKGSISSDASVMPKRRRRAGDRSARHSTDTINTSKMRGANGGFVAPMRGRGFGRGMNNNRGDMFRSRPPNTSRPPSMHVDDYIKMEMQGQGGPPTSMPPPSLPPPANQPRRMEDGGGGRGGFDRSGNRGFAGRGHFFTPPSNYRDAMDVSRGAYRGGMLMSRGMGLPSPRGMRGTATGIQLMTRGSPAKTSPAAWGGRNSRQMYGRPGGFMRGDDMQSDGQSMDRLDRQREMGGGGGGGNWYQHGGAPWSDHKDREPEQRFIGSLPPPSAMIFGGNWRDRGRHQRTLTR